MQRDCTPCYSNSIPPLFLAHTLLAITLPTSRVCVLFAAISCRKDHHTSPTAHFAPGFDKGGSPIARAGYMVPCKKHSDCMPCGRHPLTECALYFERFQCSTCYQPTPPVCLLAVNTTAVSVDTCYTTPYTQTTPATSSSSTRPPAVRARLTSIFKPAPPPAKRESASTLTAATTKVVPPRSALRSRMGWWAAWTASPANFYVASVLRYGYTLLKHTPCNNCLTVTCARFSTPVFSGAPW